MHFSRFFTLALAALSLVALSSCVTYDDGYGRDDYGYGDRGYSNRGYSSRGYGYGSSRSVCSVCGYNPCRCRGGYDHADRYQRGFRHPNRYDDRRDHSHSSSSSFKRPSNEYRVAGGSVGSKTKPEGYHTLDWYRARGYDTSRLTLKNESGNTYRRSSSSSSSNRSSASSSRSSSGSSSSRSSSSGSSSSSKKKSSSSGSSKKSSSSGLTGGAAGTGRGAQRSAR